MTPAPRPLRAAPATDIVAASLLTSGGESMVELVARNGERLRIQADKDTAEALAFNLWKALDRAA
jgi:hypothetical protein